MWKLFMKIKGSDKSDFEKGKLKAALIKYVLENELVGVKGSSSLYNLALIDEESKVRKAWNRRGRKPIMDYGSYFRF